jgi:divalent metal cation (Fe/Co/Zn/Cd) transporter
MHITVDEDLSTRESHAIAEEVRHALFHAQPMLGAVNVHVDPCGHSGEDAHAPTAHHFSASAPTENKTAPVAAEHGER